MIELTVVPGATYQAYRITLDGDEFLIEMKYSDRFNRWYFSLYDVEESPIHTQIRMVTGYRLLQSDVDARRPAGDFYVFGPDGSSDISLDDLGTINKFYYMTAEEIAALKPDASASEAITVT